MLKTLFIFSAFVMRILYFRVKKLQKATSKSKIFFFEIGKFGCQKPEFYADFRCEEMIQKKRTIKS